MRTRGWDRPLWLETSTDDPGRAMTEQAVREGVDLVLGAGGDGTIRAICSGLAGSGVPFGLIPAGTGNLLARNIGIPLDEAAALDVAFDGLDKPVDLVALTVDGGPADHFAVMAGIGIDAVIMQGTDPMLKRAVGIAAYFVSAAQHARHPALQATIRGGRRPAAQPQGPRHRDRQCRLPAGQHPADPRRPSRRRSAGRAGRLAARPAGLGAAHHPGADPAEAAGSISWTGSPAARSRSPWIGRDQYQMDGDTVGECSTLMAEVQPGALLLRVPRLRRGSTRTVGNGRHHPRRPVVAADTVEAEVDGAAADGGGGPDQRHVPVRPVCAGRGGNGGGAAGALSPSTERGRTVSP